MQRNRNRTTIWLVLITAIGLVLITATIIATTTTLTTESTTDCTIYYNKYTYGDIQILTFIYPPILHKLKLYLIRIKSGIMFIYYISWSINRLSRIPFTSVSFRRFFVCHSLSFSCQPVFLHSYKKYSHHLLIVESDVVAWCNITENAVWNNISCLPVLVRDPLADIAISYHRVHQQ